MNSESQNNNINSNDKPKSSKSNIKILYEKYLNELQDKFSKIEKNTKELNNNSIEFKEHALPLARIKKIMKLDDEVKMIAGETPILFSKACELFIIELAYRAWVHTLDNNRRTLQRSDISNAISKTDFYDFLIDIVEESCKDKLQLCANLQIDNMNMNYMQNYFNNNNFYDPNIPMIPMMPGELVEYKEYANSNGNGNGNTTNEQFKLNKKEEN